MSTAAVPGTALVAGGYRGRGLQGQGATGAGGYRGRGLQGLGATGAG